mmetsp:Transcript_144180/g.401707  ORF Transcript_144180/g.401707 Transcript_144180/m.401707 type:complete len:148 (-) Transcript_144180:259-702(-)
MLVRCRCCCFDPESSKEVVAEPNAIPVLDAQRARADRCESPPSSEAGDELEFPQPVVREFDVMLHKSEGLKRVGLDVNQRADGLKVKGIKDGLVKNYNYTQRSDDTRVLEGDFIVMVNGVAAASTELLRMIWQLKELRLTIRRHEGY